MTSIAIVTPFFLPFLQVQEETGFSRSLDDAVAYSAYLRSYLASSANAHTWLLPIIRDWNHEALFPGFVVARTRGARARLDGRTAGACHTARTERSGDGNLLHVAGRAGILGLARTSRRALHRSVQAGPGVFVPSRTGAHRDCRDAGVRRLRRAGSSSASSALPVTRARDCDCGVRAGAAGPQQLSRQLARRSSDPARLRVLAGLPRGAVAEFPFYERRIDFYIHTHLHAELHASTGSRS